MAQPIDKTIFVIPPPVEALNLLAFIRVSKRWMDAMSHSAYAEDLEPVVRRVMLALGIPKHGAQCERIRKQATEWLRIHLRSPWHYSGGDHVHIFVLLAGIRHRDDSAMGRWSLFAKNTARAVRDAPKDPARAHCLEFDEHRFKNELGYHLKSLLAEDSVPKAHWLWHAYKFAFSLFLRREPDGRPSWWQQVTGSPDEPLAPMPSLDADWREDAEGASAAVATLPGQDVIDDFIEEECQEDDALRRILQTLNTETVPMLVDSKRISKLMLIYLRYRNSPAAEMDIAPEADELARLLNERGGTNSRGGELTEDNINTVLKRIRQRVLDLVDRAVLRGELSVGAKWKEDVLPRPNWSLEGSLFPDLQKGRP